MEEKFLTELSKAKKELESMKENERKGQEIRSRIRWYEEGEKPTNFFCHLENRNYTSKLITKIEKDNGEILTEGKDILQEQMKFYQKLYAKSENETYDINTLNTISTPVLGDELQKALDKPIEKQEVATAVMAMKNNKSPGIDGFGVEFYKFFWKDLGIWVHRYIQEVFTNEKLSFTVNQGVITCIPKPGKDRSLLKNWRPITLLNILYKIISSCIANRLKLALPYLIHSNQTGFISGRCISDNIRLLYDIIFETKLRQECGLLVLIDFEKAFDTVSKTFIVKVLRKFQFGENMIKWIQILINNNQSCVYQNGHLSPFFNNERGCRQGDPMSPYLFLLVAEILGIMIRDNKEIKGIVLHNKEHKIGQYADDTELFLDGSENSLQIAINTLETFYKMSGLKMNNQKTKVVWLGVMAGSSIKICKDLQLDWETGNFEVLGITLNASLEDLWVINTRKKLDNIKRILGNWRKRNLTLVGKIIVIKALALSTLVHIFIALPNPQDSFMKDLNKIFFDFLWNGKKDKIKRENIMRNYDEGGLRMIDIISFVTALKLSYLQRYIRNNKNILNFPVNDIFRLGANSNLFVQLENPFWQDVLKAWNIFYRLYKCDGNNIDDILAEPLWLNHQFTHPNFIIKSWFSKGICSIRDICDNRDILPFTELKNKYNLQGTILHYNKMLLNIPQKWRKTLSFGNVAIENINTPEAVKSMFQLPRGSRYFYDILIKKNNWPKVCTKWEAQFSEKIEWKLVFTKYRKCTKDVKLIDFQYKFIHRKIFTKRELLFMKIVDSDICSFCKEEREDIEHVYYNCQHTKNFWLHLETFLKNKIPEIILTKLIIFFGSLHSDYLTNHIILLAKKYIHNMSIKMKTPSFENFKICLKETMKIEKYIATKNNTGYMFEQKWKPLVKDML